MNDILKNVLSSPFLITIIRMLGDRYWGLIHSIDWGRIARIGFFNMFSIVMIVSLFLANERIFNFFMRRRVKKHRMTLRNRGNVPSIFLFRTVDLPKQLAVRYRIGQSLMIMVTQKPKEVPQAKQAPEEKAAAEAVPVSSGNADDPGGLIPDLNKPLEKKQTVGETAEKAVKAVGQTGKKFGLLAGILGSISNLLPGRSKALNEAQSALKGVQQDANNLVGTVNQKTGNINTLVNQVGSLAPDSLKQQASGLKDEAVAGLKQGTLSFSDSGDEEYRQSFGLHDFSYDEEEWSKNIGKTDESNGSLVYAQSKVLNPGESMTVDIEIMNLSESNVPITYMYRIEVLQMPQTRLPLAAPRQYINGIVVFPRISRLSRVLPVGIVIILVIIAIQLIAGLSYLLF